MKRCFEQFNQILQCWYLQKNILRDELYAIRIEASVDCLLPSLLVKDLFDLPETDFSFLSHLSPLTGSERVDDLKRGPAG